MSTIFRLTHSNTSRLERISSTSRRVCSSTAPTATIDYADNQSGSALAAFAPGADLGQSETWYGKAGIRQRWHPLGHTVLYGEYENVKGSGVFSQSEDLGNTAGFGIGATHDRTQVIGGGVVQEIDAAAMSIWIKYRHLDYSDNNTEGIAYDNFQYVGMGALINF